jgi:hypothetical protein
MMRTLTLLFVGSGLLAVLCVVQMQHFGFAFDYHFSWVVPGNVLLGIASALALFSWCGKHVASSGDGLSGMQWLASASLAATGGQLALLYLPLGPVFLFLTLVMIVGCPSWSGHSVR